MRQLSGASGVNIAFAVRFGLENKGFSDTGNRATAAAFAKELIATMVSDLSNGTTLALSLRTEAASAGVALPHGMTLNQEATAEAMAVAANTLTVAVTIPTTQPALAPSPLPTGDLGTVPVADGAAVVSGTQSAPVWFPSTPHVSAEAILMVIVIALQLAQLHVSLKKPRTNSGTEPHEGGGGAGGVRGAPSSSARTAAVRSSLDGRQQRSDDHLAPDSGGGGGGEGEGGRGGNQLRATSRLPSSGGMGVRLDDVSCSSPQHIGDDDDDEKDNEDDDENDGDNGGGGRGGNDGAASFDFCRASGGGGDVEMGSVDAFGIFGGGKRSPNSEHAPLLTGDGVRGGVRGGGSESGGGGSSAGAGSLGIMPAQAIPILRANSDPTAWARPRSGGFGGAGGSLDRGTPSVVNSFL
jgi:hypothetical protein